MSAGQDPYLVWLKGSRTPLYEGCGVTWMPYHHALVPALIKPVPVKMQAGEAQRLLASSKKLFLRYFTQTFDEPTEFWYTACSDYNFDSLNKDVRRHIRRAHEQCEVRPVGADWLADNGYECYAAAFDRYDGARPEAKENFQRICREAIDGPFEFWAAIVDGKVAGYTKLVIGGDYAAAVVTKLHPEFLRHRPNYALKDSVLRNYAGGEQRKTVIDGFRAVAHKTNVHEYLLKFGYRRVYCDLQVVYRPPVRAAVSVLYPLKRVVNRMPDTKMLTGVKGLLMQEQIRRSFQ